MFRFIRLDKLRDLDSAPTGGVEKEAEEASRSRGDIYVPNAVQVHRGRACLRASACMCAFGYLRARLLARVCLHAFACTRLLAHVFVRVRDPLRTFKLLLSSPFPLPVQGKFVEFVPFDACAARPSSLNASADPSHGGAAASRNDISPLPPLPPPVDTFAFFNGDVNEMDDDDEGAGAGDATEGASVTATLEKRLRMLGEDRMQ